MIEVNEQCKECFHFQVCANVLKNQLFIREKMLKEENPKCEHFISASDVAEVVHAKWEISSDGYYPYCTHCKTEPENGVMSKYCPECGAKMDIEKE